MTDTPPKVQALYPPGDWLALRARAAETLITVADSARAIKELYELIAPDLRLNALLLWDVGRNGQLQLAAHCGISKEQAESVADRLGRAGGAEPLTGHVPDVLTSSDPRADVLKDIGLGAYAAVSLDACGRPPSILGFGRRWPDRFSEDELEFVQAISRYFAAALGRIRSEAERHAGEERLRLAMESAGFGTLDYDVAMGVHYWSPELKAIYGFAPETEITLGDLVRTVPVEDRQAVSDSIAEAAQSFARGDFRVYESTHRIVRADGELRWVTAKGRTIFSEVDGQRRPIRHLSLVQDITDRKLAEDQQRASEERMQLAQKLAGVSSWDWSPNRKLWVSDNYRAIHGLPPDAPMNWSTFKDLLHPDDREQILADFRLLRGQDGYFSVDFRILRPSDKEARWLRTQGGVVNDGSDVGRLVGITFDITEQRRQQERERLLTREVDHRAKNLLNVVQSMVQLTRADTIPEFVEEVVGRIHALARVHSLIAASRWLGASLAKIVEDELAPFSATGKRLRTRGPSVELTPAAAQTMALVIHELTTNAVKHGALARAGGKVSIEWSLSAPGGKDLVLHWRESGGPPVQPPQRKGFGTNLIHGSIERHLGGKVMLDWRRAGLLCTIALPATLLAETTDGGAHLDGSVPDDKGPRA